MLTLFQYAFVAVAIGGIAWLAYAFHRVQLTIPQSEIDVEVQHTLVEHSDNPVGYASGVVERLQWSKNGREIAKADQVLKTLRRMPSLRK